MVYETQQIDMTTFSPLVLVTDDNAQARLLLRRILEREGFRVDEAHEGSIAIERAIESEPDLILMDIQMNGLDGFQTVERLRSDPRTAKIPIIVVTAAAREASDVTRGFGLGADDYLFKPFNAGELLARANAKIRARRLEERLEKRTADLEMLVRIGREMNQALAIDQVVERLLDAVLEAMPTEYAALMLVDEEHRITLLRASGLELDEADLLSEKTLPGYVLRGGEALLIRDTDVSRIKTIFKDVECRCGIAVPFIHGGETLGVLTLGNAKVNHFTSGNLRFLRSMAEQAALAIRNAQLYTQLQNYVLNLEDMVEARTQALQAAQHQLLRAEKLAALGTLAAGVAHEVNNPLQPLLTNLELAIEDLDAQRAVDRELLEFAKDDVQRIQRIVAQLLDFARPTQSDMTPVDINELVREVMILAGKQLEHARVKVSVKAGSTQKCLGNPDQLRQVILNLVVNARDAMPEGGKLDIRTENREDQIVLTVKDTGSGIPEEALAKVFDPFFTTKKSGTGLGLSISHSIIEGHGGRIEVESKPGEFTRFTVHLPNLAAQEDEQ